MQWPTHWLRKPFGCQQTQNLPEVYSQSHQQLWALTKIYRWSCWQAQTLPKSCNPPVSRDSPHLHSSVSKGKEAKAEANAAVSAHTWRNWFLLKNKKHLDKDGLLQYWVLQPVGNNFSSRSLLSPMTSWIMLPNSLCLDLHFGPDYAWTVPPGLALQDGSLL